MMKRTAVRLGPDEPAPLPPHSPAQIQQAGASNMHTLAQSAQPSIIGATTMLSVGGAGRGGSGAGGRPVINYLKPPSQLQYAPKQQPLPRHKGPAMGRQSPGVPAGGVVGGGGGSVAVAAPAGGQFQRLKVEDALSYLDQVKYKFNSQPQVYNDFLDIMKEFKSQTIDTPGVITRVSNLFKGHPELIVGFNTFLPPGYKIEVQSNGQVSVSMPSPTGLGASGVLLGVHHAPQPQLVHLLPVPQSVSSLGPAPPPPANTLHHISQAHQQIEASMHHHSGAAPAGAGGGGHPASAPPGQPVEFNHAIEYVNKIKSRFSRQPDKYKRFLEILHAYQRGHRELKEPHAKLQTEQEVYAQVAKLFENQDDLLAEFGQFLPDAKTVTKPAPCLPHARTPPINQRAESEAERFSGASPPHIPTPTIHHQHHHQLTSSKMGGNAPPAPPAPPGTPPQHHPLKRSPSFTSSNQITGGAPPAKKPRTSGLSGATVRDVSYAEAAKFATLHEYNFFDKARKALRSQHVYDNFLRCLMLFTNEIISGSELVCVTAPFLCRHPDLQKWLQDFLGPVSPPHTPTNTNTNILPSGFNNSVYGVGATIGGSERVEPKPLRYEPLGALGAQLRHDRPQGDAAMDVDLSTCKRLGTSYCALPRDAAAIKCSGRTPLCKEVLNDTWVSFPTWSEDSTFVTSRKTQYEEYIYRCEDERFELDVVIETNAATIRVLEGVQKKLSRMTPDDAAKYRLDECLGGHSPTIHQRALRRIYGDKAVDIIAGLKKNPVVAVPVVLRRLKAKEEEWREAQKGFNKQWREQNEKYYLKSLDHQGINFKQNDLKALRSKSLFNEVEAAYAARRPPPHLVVDYNLRTRHEAIKIVRDAAELLIHHARRQTGIQKAEKRRIKQLLRHFLPDLLAHPRQPLSDDERDEEEKEESKSPVSPTTEQSVHDNDKNDSTVKQEKESSESDNASDKSGKNNKNDKENKPKNGNTTHLKEKLSLGANAVKHNSSVGGEEQVAFKSEMKFESSDIEDDFKDHPVNESRFVCTMSWYLFLRLHGVLCQRLGAARRAALALADQHGADAQRQPPSVAAALRLKPNNLPADVSSPSQYYGALLELVKGVLDGNTEPAAYEDAAREMLGIKAYPAFTLDKLVSIAVRQLQHCVSEPWSVRCYELCARGGMRGPLHYVRRANNYLRNEHTAFLVKLYGGEDCRVTFELLEGGTGGEGRASPHNNDASRLSPNAQCRVSSSRNNGAVSLAAAWSRYSEQYVRGAGTAGGGGEGGRTRNKNKPVFLRRCAARGGGGGVNAAVAGGAGDVGPAHARRKPHRLHDQQECTLQNTLRLLASRPHQLYRSGCLSAARATHARLHAARRARFHAWLRRRQATN